MIKIGDKVALFENMLKVGEIVGMYHQKSTQWMSGGVMEPIFIVKIKLDSDGSCLLYTSPSPRDRQKSRMPSSA